VKLTDTGKITLYSTMAYSHIWKGF